MSKLICDKGEEEVVRCFGLDWVRYLASFKHWHDVDEAIVLVDKITRKI